MKEAFRLLNKSIIRVETPDVNLDQDDEQQMEDQEDQDGVNGKSLTQKFFRRGKSSQPFQLTLIEHVLLFSFLPVSHLMSSRNLGSCS